MLIRPKTILKRGKCVTFLAYRAAASAPSCAIDGALGNWRATTTGKSNKTSPERMPAADSLKFFQTPLIPNYPIPTLRNHPLPAAYSPAKSSPGTSSYTLQKILQGPLSVVDDQQKVVGTLSVVGATKMSISPAITKKLPAWAGLHFTPYSQNVSGAWRSDLLVHCSFLKKNTYGILFPTKKSFFKSALIACLRFLPFFIFPFFCQSTNPRYHGKTSFWPKDALYL